MFGYLSFFIATARSVPGAMWLASIIGLGMAVIKGGNVIQGASESLFEVALGSPALGSTTAVHAAVADSGEDQEITTGITNPDVPRNITATAGGTGANVTAVRVTVHGTDADGQAISEQLPAFTAGQAGTVAGNKAFKTVTSITIPANGDGVTTAIGTGAKLGLGTRLKRNTVITAYLDGAKEGTAPTVVIDADEISGNTVTLNSALNGSEVVVEYVQTH
jgi:hypothetical protein